MKNNFQKILYTAVIFSATVLQSCDNGFEELNTNPDASPEIIPGYVFSKAQYDAAGDLLMGTLGAMQYTTSFNEVGGFGSKYIFLQGTAPHVVFNNAYVKEINEIGEVIRAVSEDPEDINKLAAARIWRVYSFHRITDLYGDIPYSQAALGYTESIFKPEYDAQQDIYTNMLEELEAAASSFDASKATFGSSDLVYGGNIDQWKKFAYSLMLRLGMRLTKVDLASAETWVKKAIAGGVIKLDTDIAMIKYINGGQDINKNPMALSLLGSDYIYADGVSNQEGGKYQKVFIDYLLANEDPRLGVISVVYVGGVADTSAVVQKGMPSNLTSKPADFATYSEPNQNTLLLKSAPMLLFTNAEGNLLLAEAAARGWYTDETAEDLFVNGTSAGLRQWALYGDAGKITPGRINSYLADHPYAGGTLDEQLEQIHTQFWIAVFPDAQEVFANWRRTGFPVLTPNNVINNATNGQIFRRMLYPPIEQNLNADNYQAAITRQGANDFMTKIWWDK
jgi:hypothetical protein